MNEEIFVQCEVQLKKFIESYYDEKKECPEFSDAIVKLAKDISENSHISNFDFGSSLVFQTFRGDVANSDDISDMLDAWNYSFFLQKIRYTSYHHTFFVLGKNSEFDSNRFSLVNNIDEFNYYLDVVFDEAQKKFAKNLPRAVLSIKKLLLDNAYSISSEMSAINTKTMHYIMRYRDALLSTMYDQSVLLTDTIKDFDNFKGEFDKTKEDFDTSKREFEKSKEDFDTSKGEFEKSKEDFNTSKGEFEKSREDFDEANENLKKAQDETKSLFTNTITVIGIFISIFVGITGTLDIADAVLRFESTYPLQFVNYGILLIIGLIDVVFLLLFTISRVGEKDIGVRCTDSGCSICGDCKKKCSMIRKLRFRYPYMYWSNIIAFAILVFVGLYNAFIDIFLPTIKAMYRSYITLNFLVIIFLGILFLISLISFGCVLLGKSQGNWNTKRFLKLFTLFLLTIFFFILILCGISYINEQNAENPNDNYTTVSAEDSKVDNCQESLKKLHKEDSN